MWESEPPQTGEPLGAALSHGRASILKSLVVPSTTTEQQLVENLLRGIEK
jgi:hypothetical protein